MADFELPSDLNSIFRIVLIVALGILLLFLVVAKAEALLIIGVLIAIIFIFTQTAPKSGSLTRATNRRKAGVAANAQPTLRNLIRTSGEIGAGKAVVIGRISGMVKLRDIESPLRVSAPIKPGEKAVPAPVADVLYEITVQEGWGPNKREELFLVRKSDLLLVDPKTPINGDVTVKCSGFVPSSMHLVPDTWSQSEVNKIEIAVTRTFVSQMVAEETLEDMGSAVSSAKKSDPVHQKKLEEIDRGVSNPGQ